MYHWKQRLGLGLVILFLLTSTCGEQCRDVWAVCPNKELNVCSKCKLMKDIETDFYRFGQVKDCATGWGKRVVVDKDCAFEYR